MNMNGSHATRLWLKRDDTMNVWNAIEHVKKRGMLFRHKIIKYHGEPKTNTLIFLNGDEYCCCREQRWKWCYRRANHNQTTNGNFSYKENSFACKRDVLEQNVMHFPFIFEPSSATASFMTTCYKSHIFCMKSKVIFITSFSYLLWISVLMVLKWFIFIYTTNCLISNTLIQNWFNKI